MYVIANTDVQLHNLTFRYHKTLQ